MLWSLQILSHLILITYSLGTIFNNPFYREVTNLNQFHDPFFFNDKRHMALFLF